MLFLASNCLTAVGYRPPILRVLMKNSPLKLVATTIVRMCQGCCSLYPTASSLRTPGEEFLSDLSTGNSCPSEQLVCFYLLDIVNCVTRFLSPFLFAARKLRGNFQAHPLWEQRFWWYAFLPLFLTLPSVHSCFSIFNLCCLILWALVSYCKSLLRKGKVGIIK